MGQRPLEARYIGSSKSKLSATFNDEQPVTELIVNQTMHDGRRPVWRTVVNYKNMEALFKIKYRTDYFLDILFLVVCRNNYDAVTFVHHAYLLEVYILQN